jgi:hypothetical protein
MSDSKLVGSGRTGDVVHSNQKMASSNNFRNVSGGWLKICSTYEQGHERLSAGRAQTEDFDSTIEHFFPSFDGKKMVFVDEKTKKTYSPTGHCLAQISRWAGTGTYLPAKLAASSNPEDQRVLTDVISNGLRNIDKDKRFFWRTRTDGTLRAMLSDRYMEVSNQWLLESLEKIIPGGMLSHWRGDQDTVWGNVLIPDTIREESDSEYGGMLSVGNSEIGARKISSLPSVFRAICENGCIWNKSQGISVEMRHNGKPNYERLYASLYENITSQIPLLSLGIDKMMLTKNKKWDGQDILPIFAQIAVDFKVSKRSMPSVVEAYEQEVSASSESRNTLFGVLNAFTRSGQNMQNDSWYAFDLLAGRLMEVEWDSISYRAKSMKADAVGKALGLAV